MIGNVHGRERGVALLMVLATVVVVATLTTTFISALSTTVAISRNIENKAKAFHVAESGLRIAAAYVQATATWRNDQTHGSWVIDAPFGEGTYTIIGEDGADADGNGVISQPSEGDGDLSDDDADLLTLTVTGNVGGAVHVVRAVVSPTCSGASPVVYEAFAEAKSSSGTKSITISLPSGTSEDDLLIAVVVTDWYRASSLSPPGGEGWTTINVDEDGGVTLGVWWKIASASESSTHQFTWGGILSQECYAWMMRFTGHDPAGAINASASAGNGGSSSPTSPLVTTTVVDTLILRIGGFDDDDVSIDSPGLTGHTAITMDESGSGSGTCSGGAGYLTQSSIGASGTSNFALTGSEGSRTVTVAIAPDPDGGCGGTPTYTVRWTGVP